MRTIVAIGLATFVACCVATASWADEAAPCAEGKCCEGKCSEAKSAACCPACPTATAAAVQACCEKSCKTCETTSTEAESPCTESPCTESPCTESPCTESPCTESPCTESQSAASQCTKGQCALSPYSKGQCDKGQCDKGQCAATKCAKCTGHCSECTPWEPTAVAASPIARANSIGAPGDAIQALATSKGPTGATRRYTVKMRMLEGGAEKELAAPTICVFEGASASVKSGSSRPFVTGVRKSHDGMAQPIITVLDEGTTIEVRVTPLANRRVQLDATIEQTTIDREEEVESPFQTEEERETLQAPEVSSQSRRVVRAVELGDTVTLRCGCACGTEGEQGTVVQLTVDQVGAPTPGITPITKVTATEEIKGDELYHVVYPVSDLLEPYAVHKEGAAVEAADFLPVIDMLLTEAGCDWPAEAEIRPFEANQSVVISQTEAGHQAISKYLDRKRACVAEIEANLLRK